MTEYEPILENLDEARDNLRKAHLKMSEIIENVYNLKAFGEHSVTRSRLWQVHRELYEITDEIHHKLICKK